MPLSRLEIRQEIKKLNRLDPKLASYAAISTTYSRITDGFVTIAGKAAAGELFYRVRRTGGPKPRHVSELKAPPAELVTGYQRCNPPGIPMFYAASRRGGALAEARVEIGEVVYLSQWIGRSGIPLNRIFDSEENQMVPGVDMSAVYGPNDDMVLAYLDTQFTKRIHSTFSDDYKFTAAIAQQLTTNFSPDEGHDIREDRCVALKYPSVWGLERFHNTAMHANFASERLELLHVMELKVLSVEELDISVEVIDTAIEFENGGLNWSSNANLVPALLDGKRNVPFIFDGRKWNLRIHDGAVTPEYMRLLMAD